MKQKRNCNQKRKKIIENLDNEAKEKFLKSDWKRKTVPQHLENEVREKSWWIPRCITSNCKEKNGNNSWKQEGNRDQTFHEVKNCIMIEPSILISKACKIIQETYSSGNRKEPDYICNICHKFENWECLYLFFMFDQSWYEQEVVEKCDTKKSVDM